MVTEAERAAGRAFRDSQLAHLGKLNATDPVPLSPPPFLRHIRHLCEVAGKSVSFDYAEVYITDATRRFAFVYHEGRCARCGLRARSKTGRVVGVPEREPLGAKVRLSG